MPFIEDFAQQAAQQTLGAGLGIILGGINDRRQLRQQEKLQGMQIRGQKEMTDYQMMKQLEMWDKTNFSAQVAQLHKAGLNPALLYGKGGAGGATAAVTPGNVTGGHAPVGGGEPIAMGMSMAQMGLLKAQRENIEASTQLTKAQAAKTAGVDTTLGETQIQDLLQGINNKKAEKELTEVQEQIKNVELEIAHKTQNQIIAKIATELRYITAQMHIWERNNNIDAQTADEKIRLIEQQVIETGARILLTNAQTAQTTEQTANISKQLALAYEQLKNEKDKTAIAKKLQEFETSFGKQAASILGSIIGGIK